jgi:hypothetical protein
MISTIVLLVLFIIVIVLFIISKKYTPENYKHESLIISKSEVNGMGVFTTHDINNGDVIIRNMFNGHNPYSLGEGIFKMERFMSMFNHCSTSDNATMVKDGNEYHLIATKLIHAGTEITANYDKVGSIFDFVKPSEPEFRKC